MRLFFWLAALSLLVVTGASAQEQPARTSPSFRPHVEATLSSGKTDMETGAIVYTSDVDALEALGLRVQARFPGFVTVRGASSAIVAAAQLPSVQYVDAGSEAYPENDGAAALTGARALQQGALNGTAYTGRGAIVCVIDTGIDWQHGDFSAPSSPLQSRILRIWDQTLAAQTGESAPAGFTYGVEYTREQIEAAYLGGPAPRTKDINGHGTHVAGTAAGNGKSLIPAQHAGMAPEADLVVIKAGDGSFSADNIVNGIDYCDRVATAAGKPAVVNMSLGSQFGAHDGTEAKEVAASTFGGKPGRVAVFSAGNDGSRNLHVSGTTNPGATSFFLFSTPPNIGGSGSSQLSFDLWYDASNDATATVTTPGGTAVVQLPGGEKSMSTSDGTVYLFNYLNPGSLLRRINVQISGSTLSSGLWKLEITNSGASRMGYHGWIYANKFGDGQEATLGGADAQYTLSNTPLGALTVASYAHRWRWCADDGRCWLYSNDFDGSDAISSFSSAGPTRDGRTLPHVAAPGQGVVSSLSRDLVLASDHSRLFPGRRHWLTQGTSMAAPVVAGAVALLMQHDPTLDYARVAALLQAEADADAFTGALPNTRWGAGKLDIYGAMARLISPTSIAEREVLAYDDVSGNGAVQVPGNTRMALRFTPTGSGPAKVTGVLFHTNTDNTFSDPLLLEVWTDAGGVPGERIGQTVSVPKSSVPAFGWAYANLSAAGANITAGQSYFLVMAASKSSESFTLRHDGGTTTGRSMVSVAGNTWSALGYDLRIRPIVTSNALTTDIVSADEGLDGLTLQPAFPNPSAGEVGIRFVVPSAGAARVDVYDALGRRVAVLFDESAVPGQLYRLRFSSETLSAGVYFVRLTHGGAQRTQTVVVAR